MSRLIFQDFVTFCVWFHCFCMLIYLWRDKHFIWCLHAKQAASVHRRVHHSETAQLNGPPLFSFSLTPSLRWHVATALWVIISDLLLPTFIPVQSSSEKPSRQIYASLSISSSRPLLMRKFTPRSSVWVSGENESGSCRLPQLLPLLTHPPTKIQNATDLISSLSLEKYSVTELPGHQPPPPPSISSHSTRDASYQDSYSL